MPKILIADDETYVRLLLEDALENLEDEGVELLTADNGEIALEIIKRDKPELVFLDIMMPKLHGFDVCTTLKNDPETSEVTVVILTGRGQESDKAKGLKCGADKYITKPIKTDEIEALAREVLGL